MCKRYLELRYRAEILKQDSLSRALEYVSFQYLHLGPNHGRRREEHPHEAHQEDEKSIELEIPDKKHVNNFKTNRYQLV